MANHYYIGVNKFVGQQHVPDLGMFEKLAKSYEYIVCQEFQSLPGSFWFNFTVFDSSLKGTRIKNNGWTVDKIYTAASDKAQPVIFTITDREGISNVDAGIIRASKPYDDFSFPGLGVDSLNKGLEFFEQVSKYVNWTEFLNSERNEEFTLKSSQTGKVMHRANNERLAELERENQELKDKLSQISLILA